MTQQRARLFIKGEYFATFYTTDADSASKTAREIYGFDKASKGSTNAILYIGDIYYVIGTGSLQKNVTQLSGPALSAVMKANLYAKAAEAEQKLAHNLCMCGQIIQPFDLLLICPCGRKYNKRGLSLRTYPVRYGGIVKTATKTKPHATARDPDIVTHTGEFVYLRVRGVCSNLLKRENRVNDQYEIGETYSIWDDIANRCRTVECVDWFQPAGPRITVFFFELRETEVERAFLSMFPELKEGLSQREAKNTKEVAEIQHSEAVWSTYMQLTQDLLRVPEYVRDAHFESTIESLTGGTDYTVKTLEDVVTISESEDGSLYYTVTSKVGDPNMSFDFAVTYGVKKGTNLDRRLRRVYNNRRGLTESFPMALVEFEALLSGLSIFSLHKVPRDCCDGVIFTDLPDLTELTPEIEEQIRGRFHRGKDMLTEEDQENTAEQVIYFRDMEWLPAHELQIWGRVLRHMDLWKEGEETEPTGDVQGETSDYIDDMFYTKVIDGEERQYLKILTSPLYADNDTDPKMTAPETDVQGVCDAI